MYICISQSSVQLKTKSRCTLLRTVQLDVAYSCNRCRTVPVNAKEVQYQPEVQY